MYINLIYFIYLYIILYLILFLFFIDVSSSFRKRRPSSPSSVLWTSWDGKDEYHIGCGQNNLLTEGAQLNGSRGMFTQSPKLARGLLIVGGRDRLKYLWHENISWLRCNIPS